MAISNKKIDEHINNYNTTEFNNFVMGLTDHLDLENILIAMLKRGKWEERVQRTYSRYSVLRRKFEKKMLKKREWY